MAKNIKKRETMHYSGLLIEGTPEVIHLLHHFHLEKESFR